MRIKKLYLAIIGAFILGMLSTDAGAQQNSKKTGGQQSGAIRVSAVDQPGSKIKGGRATVIIDAPFDKVMRVVQDYGSYASFLPHFQVSRVLAQRGANAIVYLEASILKGAFKVWVQERFRSRPQQGKTRIIEGKMTKGNIDNLNARWEITPIADGRTQVVFQMFFDIDLPLPSSVISDHNVIAARRTVRAIRKKIQQLAQNDTKNVRIPTS